MKRRDQHASGLLLDHEFLTKTEFSVRGDFDFGSFARAGPCLVGNDGLVLRDRIDAYNPPIACFSIEPVEEDPIMLAQAR